MVTTTNRAAGDPRRGIISELNGQALYSWVAAALVAVMFIPCVPMHDYNGVAPTE